VLRGIYSSAAGMVMEMAKVSMHAQNIANAQSAGFRGREMSSVPFKELMINIMRDQQGKAINVPVGTGSGPSLQTLNETQGSLKPTGNTFDIAIEGNGWITYRKGKVENVANEYTSRNGRMLLDKDGFIVNAEGDFLVNQKGQNIQLTAGRTTSPEKNYQSRITINENGIINDNGVPLPDGKGQLKIQADTINYKAIPELQLMIPDQVVIQRDLKTGDLIPNITGTPQKDLPPGQKDKVSVKQGFIEGSNIQIVSEMIGLIQSSKDYESGHKLIMAEDKVLDKAINELGRTG
jgi:flagellar basal-body rod protein FlgF